MSFNQFRHPKAFEFVVDFGTTFGSDNLIEIPGVAVALQIWNECETEGGIIYVRLNGDTEATFHIRAGGGISLNAGDCYVTSIDFANTTSGSPACPVQVICGVVSE